MKKLLLGTAALGALAMGNTAFAADIPVKAPPVVPAWSWSGCYVGGNVGLDQGRHYADVSPSGLYRTVPPGAAAPPNAAGTGDFPVDVAALSHSYSSTNSSWEGGVQVGCNQQYGVVVLGAEADWQWTGVRSTIDSAFAAFPNVGNPAFTNAAHVEHVDVSKKWFGTARGRVGFTPWDRVLIYGTAGIAWANYESNTAVAFGTFPVLPVYNGAVHLGSGSSTQIGGVVGTGIEWAFMNNWSVKVEYLYMWFNGFSYSSPLVASAAPAAPGYSWNTTITPREQVIRVGVNYKFDWAAPAAVVSKY